jgi:hypothetical protein
MLKTIFRTTSMVLIFWGVLLLLPLRVMRMSGLFLSLSFQERTSFDYPNWKVEDLISDCNEASALTARFASICSSFVIAAWKYCFSST